MEILVIASADTPGNPSFAKHRDGIYVSVNTIDILPCIRKICDLDTRGT